MKSKSSRTGHKYVTYSPSPTGDRLCSLDAVGGITGCEFLPTRLRDELASLRCEPPLGELYVGLASCTVRLFLDRFKVSDLGPYVVEGGICLDSYELRRRSRKLSCDFVLVGALLVRLL